MKTIISLFLFLTICFTSYGQTKISEKEYAMYIQSLIGGELEYYANGGYVDLLTDEYAIEIERASEWQESIGQCLWYALNTNKKPAIILLIEDSADYKYYIRLNSVIEYAGIADKITVWQFPKDFQQLIDKSK